VDIISVEDIAEDVFQVRQGKAYDRQDIKYEGYDKSKKHLMNIGIKINFKISFTLQDFGSTNANVTVAILKKNFVISVVNKTFHSEFAEQLKERNVNQTIITQMVPADVVLSTSFIVIETTDMPTSHPSPAPTTGKT
jgi:hypothetical protein